MARLTIVIVRSWVVYCSSNEIWQRGDDSLLGCLLVSHTTLMLPQVEIDGSLDLLVRKANIIHLRATIEIS